MNGVASAVWPEISSTGSPASSWCQEEIITKVATARLEWHMRQREVHPKGSQAPSEGLRDRLRKRQREP